MLYGYITHDNIHGKKEKPLQRRVEDITEEKDIPEGPGQNIPMMSDTNPALRYEPQNIQGDIGGPGVGIDLETGTRYVVDQDDNPVARTIGNATRQSLIGKMIMPLIDEERARTVYVPPSGETETGERIATNVISILMDAPSFKVGGIAGRGIAGGVGLTRGVLPSARTMGLASTSGAFGLHSGAHTAMDGINRDKFSLTDTVIDTGKGALTGLVVGATGQAIAKTMPQVTMINPVANVAYKGAREGMNFAGMTASLTGTSAVLHDQPLTVESTSAAAAEVLILTLLHKLPGAASRIQTIAKERNIPVEQVVKEVAPNIDAQAILKAPKRQAEQILDAELNRVGTVRVAEGQAAQMRKHAERIRNNEAIPEATKTELIQAYEARAQRFERIAQELQVRKAEAREVFKEQARQKQLEPQEQVVRNMQAEKPAERREEQGFYSLPETAKLIDRVEMFERKAKEVYEPKRRYETDRYRDRMDQAVSENIEMTRRNLEGKGLTAQDILREPGLVEINSQFMEGLPVSRRNAVKAEVLEHFYREAGGTPEQNARSLKYLDQAEAIKYQLEMAKDRYNKQFENVPADYIPMPGETVAGRKYTPRENTPESFAPFEGKNRVVDGEVMSSREAFKIEQAQKRTEAEQRQLDIDITSRMQFEKFKKAQVSEWLPEAKNKETQALYRIEGERAEFARRNLKEAPADILDHRLQNNSRFIETWLGKTAAKLLVNAPREAQDNIAREKKAFEAAIAREFGKIKESDRQAVGAFLAARDKVGREILKESGIVAPEKLSPELEVVAKRVDKILADFFNRVNAMRESIGEAPIPAREGYYTFIRKMSWLEQNGMSPATVPIESYNMINPYAELSKVSFRFGRKRVDSTRMIELDPMKVLLQYGDSSIRAIHMSPVVKRQQKIYDVGEVAQWKNRSYKAIMEYNQYLAGGKISNAPQIWNTALTKINGNVAAYLLAYNVDSIANQPTAIVNTVALLGPKATARGVSMYMNPANRKMALQKSNILYSRYHGGSMETFEMGKLGSFKRKATEIGTFGLRYLDLQTASITWLAAYNKAGGGVKAARYADSVVAKTQGSAEKVDLAPIQRTPTGKAAFFLGTFTINNWNFVKNEILGMKNENVTRGQALRNTLGLVAAITAANTIQEFMGQKGIFKNMGIPTPFSGNTANPNPVTEFIEKLQAEYEMNPRRREPKSQGKMMLDAFLAALREAAGLHPVIGGGLKYGRQSMMGIFGMLFGDTLDFLSGKPHAKSAAEIAGRWAGIPGGGQIAKYIKRHDREVKEREKQVKQNRIQLAPSSGGGIKGVGKVGGVGGVKGL